MGTRRNFPEWVPYQGLGTPSFCPPFRDANMIGHALEGPGPCEHPEALRAEETIHLSGVPLRKGGGVGSGAAVQP